MVFIHNAYYNSVAVALFLLICDITFLKSKTPVKMVSIIHDITLCRTKEYIY